MQCNALVLMCVALCWELVYGGQYWGRNLGKPSKMKQWQPKIESLHINSTIKFRYAQTTVTSRIKNPMMNDAQEVRFLVTLPDSAFISNFTISIAGNEYVARVEKKEEAKQQYEAAVAAGRTAAHVDARDSNNFEVSVNVEAQAKITFDMKYEELLQRTRGFYQNSININPGQVVKDMSVNVYIEESRNIVSVKVPEVTNNNILNQDDSDNMLANITGVNSKSVHISYHPSEKEQEDISQEGITGQFIVQYKLNEGDTPEIQVIDGYFVHFFAPAVPEPMSKHVVFVLDTSGSMYGRRMEQLKSAMDSILSDLSTTDYFSIISFSDEAKVWKQWPTKDISKVPSYTSTAPTTTTEDITEDTTTKKTTTTAAPPLKLKTMLSASDENKKAAKEYVTSLRAVGSTNIESALSTALYESKKSVDRKEIVTLIIFLTDGEPTVGEINPDQIIKNVKKSNLELQVPIYSLAFGDGTDFDFLKKLSLRNYAFARKIYEASDAVIQLKNFYQELSVPLLSNITVTYLNDTLINSTQTMFPTYFRGSEIVVAGKLADPCVHPIHMWSRVTATSATGNYNNTIQPDVEGAYDNASNTNTHYNQTWCGEYEQKGEYSSFLDRLYAYLTIKNIMDDIERTDDVNMISELEKRAVELSTQYNFVTDFTSMIVIKPEDSTQSCTDNNNTDCELLANHGVCDINPEYCKKSCGVCNGSDQGNSTSASKGFRVRMGGSNLPMYDSFDRSFGGNRMSGGSFNRFGGGSAYPAYDDYDDYETLALTSAPVTAQHLTSESTAETVTSTAGPQELAKGDIQNRNHNLSISWLNGLRHVGDDYGVQIHQKLHYFGFNETVDKNYGECSHTNWTRPMPGTCRLLKFCYLEKYQDFESFKHNSCEIINGAHSISAGVQHDPLEAPMIGVCCHHEDTNIRLEASSYIVE